MPNHPHEMGKHLLDLLASTGALFTILSHFAELAHPIISCLVGLAALAWWWLRYWDWWHNDRKRGVAVPPLMNDREGE